MFNGFSQFKKVSVYRFYITLVVLSFVSSTFLLVSRSFILSVVSTTFTRQLRFQGKRKNIVGLYAVKVAFIISLFKYFTIIVD